MTEYIIKALVQRATGLALHYPFIHAAVVGMNARRTLEFSAGGSTRVILDALPAGGRHVSVSTEHRHEIIARYEIGGRDTAQELVEAYGHLTGRERVFQLDKWTHHHGKSEQFRDIDPGPLDIILHDGFHAADVVAADIAWAWPHLRRYGLLLVHDTAHFYCGAEVREGLKRGLSGAKFTAITLPYGFGLTIVWREDGEEFTEQVMWPNGHTEPRFMEIG